jgi:GTP-binding protein
LDVPVRKQSGKIEKNMSKVIDQIRNIAIIAHVDHGKTTLVDAMFNSSGAFRNNLEKEARVMDNMDLERERGITINAKNCSVMWNGVKINILDTPGHADFGGEVERALSMTNGAILLVDSSEGPLPQTRFVLKKALESGLKIIVVINKIDRKDARPQQVLDEIYDLFIELDADDEQLDFEYLYAIGRDGICKRNLDDPDEGLTPLFDAIINIIPPPEGDLTKPLQVLVSDLGYSDYLGRLAIGRIFNGHARFNEAMVCLGEKGKRSTFKANKLQIYDGLDLVESTEVSAGEIIVISGMDEIKIGDTICTPDTSVALPRVTVDEPTISMEFTINTSPFSGREGKIVQSSKIRERLIRETLKNVAIRFEETPDRDKFIVKGRGEFQMAILIETMRREGFELCVGRPTVINRIVDGRKHEPIEDVYVDCDDNYVGIVTEKLGIRRGRLMSLCNSGSGRVQAHYSAPSRALIGYRDEFLTDTRGTGVMNTLFSGYEEYRGDFPSRFTGSLVADRQGSAVAYALFNLEPRGRLFVAPGELVYEGMIVGEHSKDNDLNVNAVKTKKLTNMRASGKDDSTTCTAIQPMTLERAINFIRDDEMVEVTPKSIRLHKRILSQTLRNMSRSKEKHSA